MTGVIWSELGVKVEKSFTSVNVRVNCWEIRVFFSRLRRNVISPLREKYCNLSYLEDATRFRRGGGSKHLWRAIRAFSKKTNLPT